MMVIFIRKFLTIITTYLTEKIAQNYSLLFQNIKIVNNFAAKPRGINEYGSNICIVLLPPNCHNNT